MITGIALLSEMKKSLHLKSTETKMSGMIMASEREES